MTEILKCPFCEEDLKEWDGRFYCANVLCPAKQEDLPKFIWQALIDGKKAQRQLRTVKDRCVKKIKAKEFEIHNCLYGIHARDYEIETLQEQLRQAQDAIQKIKDIVYPALDKEFYSELRDDMLDIGRIIVSVEKQEK